MNTQAFELRPASDFAGAVAAEQKRPRLVTIEDGHFCVHDPDLYGSTYDIPIQSCTSRDDILIWIRQLSEKRWVTTLVIEDFVRAMIRQFEVNG